VRLLVDAMLPETVVTEAPPGVEVLRWSGGDVSDEDLLRAGAHEDVRAVVFLDRRSLYQPGLRELAAQLQVALVAIEADDPVEAKDRLFQNLDHVRKALNTCEVVLVLAHDARPIYDSAAG
jgi:hypothetical protein